MEHFIVMADRGQTGGRRVFCNKIETTAKNQTKKIRIVIMLSMFGKIKSKQHLLGVFDLNVQKRKIERIMNLLWPTAASIHIHEKQDCQNVNPFEFYWSTSETTIIVIIASNVKKKYLEYLFAYMFSCRTLKYTHPRKCECICVYE